MAPKVAARLTGHGQMWETPKTVVVEEVGTAPDNRLALPPQGQGMPRPVTLRGDLDSPPLCLLRKTFRLEEPTARPQGVAPHQPSVTAPTLARPARPVRVTGPVRKVYMAQAREAPPRDVGLALEVCPPAAGLRPTLVNDRPGLAVTPGLVEVRRPVYAAGLVGIVNPRLSRPSDGLETPGHAACPRLEATRLGPDAPCLVPRPTTSRNADANVANTVVAAPVALETATFVLVETVDGRLVASLGGTHDVVVGAARPRLKVGLATRPFGLGLAEP